MLKIPTGRRQTSWLFTSVAEAGLEPGPPDSKSGALITGPRRLPNDNNVLFTQMDFCAILRDHFFQSLMTVESFTPVMCLERKAICTRARLIVRYTMQRRASASMRQIKVNTNSFLYKPLNYRRK